MNKACDLNLTSNKPSRAKDDITYYLLHITQCVGTINGAWPMTITKPTPMFVKQDADSISDTVLVSAQSSTNADMFICNT